MDWSYVLAGLLLQLIGVEKCKELRSRSWHISKTTITKSKTKKKPFLLKIAAVGKARNISAFYCLFFYRCCCVCFNWLNGTELLLSIFATNPSSISNELVHFLEKKTQKTKKKKKKNIQQICCFEFAVVKIQLKPFKYWPDLRGWISLLQFLVNIKYWSYL